VAHAVFFFYIDIYIGVKAGAIVDSNVSGTRITKTDGTFSLACRVEINIRAKSERVWALLTDAKGFPRWNSTVTGIEGQIREGEKLQLRVPGSDRVFTPAVSDVIANKQMTWTGGFAPMFKGVRTFNLISRDDGSTDFQMQERFSGLMLPLIKRSLPDFGPIFEAYANDLKREAERSDVDHA